MNRHLVAAATCAAAFSAAVLPAVPAAADTGVDDYPQHLRSASRGSKVDPWRFYNRYCTSFVAFRVNDIVGRPPSNPWFTNFMGGGHFSDARSWDDNARRLGWRVDRKPTVGSIYQTETTARGHVAMVTAVRGNRVRLEEYNLGDGAYHNHRWVNWAADSTADFIHVPPVERELATASTARRVRVDRPAAGGSIAAAPTAADVDGDGADELAVRAANRFRFNLDNRGGGERAYRWGRSADEPFTADVDGDGTDDVGIRRDNRFFVDTDLAGGTDVRVAFGGADDTLLVGDYDGDGDDELALFDDGTWLVNSDMRGGADTRWNWGRRGDEPFVGDFDGDGRTDLGLRRNGRLFVDVDRDATMDHRMAFGEADDTLLVGDFDGDGADDLGLWDQGTWRFDLNLRGGAEKAYWWGRSTDVPFTGDFDGDGDADAAIRRGQRSILDLDLDDRADRSMRFGAKHATLVGPS